MNAQAQRLLSVRSLAIMEISACTHKIVSIDAQLDALALSEADQQIVNDIRETQDTTMADAITDPTQLTLQATA